MRVLALGFLIGSFQTTLRAVVEREETFLGFLIGSFQTPLDGVLLRQLRYAWIP